MHDREVGYSVWVRSRLWQVVSALPEYWFFLSQLRSCIMVVRMMVICINDSCCQDLTVVHLTTVQHSNIGSAQMYQCTCYGTFDFASCTPYRFGSCAVHCGR
eukprot:GHUV01000967.1.p1 GENE.GHUV01000967.1~~GHUV01000967.1.p1  ORF type:complete len:102 (+),score=12.17 GHUV01000967.1:503-808(+)